MKALVVYESLYGNTAAVGEAIAAALRSQGVEVEAGPISKIDPTEAEGADLLVVGGPTHAHGMSRSSTRKVAVEDKKNTYPEPTVAPGLREWLDGVPSETGLAAAAFDTRINKAILFTGSAARGIARRLEHQGYHLVVGPECFLVTTGNVLAEGEIEHARAWGIGVAGKLSTGVSR